MTEKCKIINQGMGGFLNPPGHPEHNYSVQTDLRRKPENRGSMALSYALKSSTVDSLTLARVMTLLSAWEATKPPLTDPAVKDWIRQVLGYYKGCFNFQPEIETGWHAGSLTIDSNLDPLENADFHAGVHLIRRYYSEYKPTAEDFANAYWGKQSA